MRTFQHSLSHPAEIWYVFLFLICDSVVLVRFIKWKVSKLYVQQTEKNNIMYISLNKFINVKQKKKLKENTRDNIILFVI